VATGTSCRHFHDTPQRLDNFPADGSGPGLGRVGAPVQIQGPRTRGKLQRLLLTPSRQTGHSSIAFSSRTRGCESSGRLPLPAKLSPLARAQRNHICGYAVTNTSTHHASPVRPCVRSAQNLLLSTNRPHAPVPQSHQSLSACCVIQAPRSETRAGAGSDPAIAFPLIRHSPCIFGRGCAIAGNLFATLRKSQPGARPPCFSRPDTSNSVWCTPGAPAGP
jgi:hypothetical protein